MSIFYETFEQYLNEAYLTEADANTDYERTFSDIPRDLFDQLIRLDSKSKIINDEVKNIGPVTKFLILPKYQAGETDFASELPRLETALTLYNQNMGKYPRFTDFKSVADFLRFMDDPDNAEIETAEQISKMDTLFDKYYAKDFQRDIFDKIIAMDPKTTDDRIGDIAKNFLLLKYKAGEHSFLDTPEAVTDAIDRFNEKGRTYTGGKDNIQNYASVEEFINYIPDSPSIEALRNNTAARQIEAGTPNPTLEEGVDYEVVASSPEYDVFRLLTWKGSRIIGQIRGLNSKWCTAGGRDGTSYGASWNTPTNYWNSYTSQSNLYPIISRLNPQDPRQNYQVAMYHNGSGVHQFLDGNDEHTGSDYTASCKAFLLKNPILVKNLLKSNDSLFGHSAVVKDVAEVQASVLGPVIVASRADIAKILRNADSYKATVKELYINDISSIPFGLFSEFLGLKKVVIGPGVEKISGQAFKGCVALKTIEFSESLKVIGSEAFAGCSSLSGSIKLPNNVEKIERGAFENTHCALKIDYQGRRAAGNQRLSVSKADEVWMKSHLKGIKVQ